MADTVTSDVLLRLESTYINVPNDGGGPYTRTPATARGGNPGVVTLTTTPVAVSFTGLVKPHEVRIENIGTGVVRYGPDSGGATLVLLGELDPGEVNLVSLARSTTPTLLMQVASGTGVARVTALDD